MKLSLLFTISAASIILMLSIVPHHHHNGAVCMIMKHCEKDHSDDDMHDGCHNDKDMKHNQSCVAESDYILKIETRTKSKISLSDDYHNSGYILSFYIQYFIPGILPYPVIHTGPDLKPEYGQYILFYTSAETSQFHGLRAPPYLLS